MARWRMARRGLATALGGAALAAGAPAAGAAVATEGWHQTYFLSRSYGGWIGERGGGAVLARAYDPVTDLTGPWQERPLLPDGSLGPAVALDPVLVPGRESTVVGSGHRVVLDTPAGLVVRGPSGLTVLGQPVAGLSGPRADANARGDVLLSGTRAGSGDRAAAAVHRDGRWRVAPAFPRRPDPLAQAVGESGAAVVVAMVDGRLTGVAFAPGGGWRRLAAARAPDPDARVDGVAIDGNGVATVVYSAEGRGTLSRSLARGARAWAAPARVGATRPAGDGVATDRAGRAWSVLASGDAALAVMSRPPGGGWRREASLPGSAATLRVGPLGEVMVSAIDPDFDGTWSVHTRDPVSGRFTETGNHLMAGAITAAGNALSAHIHPIEHGNLPQAYADRYLAPPRAEVVAVQAPKRIRRGATERVYAAVSGPGPLVVSVASIDGPQVVAAGVARRAGSVGIALPGRLTRTLPLGPARVTVTSGHAEPSRASRSTLVRLVDGRASGARGGGAVELSAAQLRVNQRVSQAAARRANANIALIEAGLGDASFARGELAARDPAPAFKVPRALLTA